MGLHILLAVNNNGSKTGSTASAKLCENCGSKLGIAHYNEGA
jgi:hypothetical protein